MSRKQNSIANESLFLSRIIYSSSYIETFRSMRPYIISNNSVTNNNLSIKGRFTTHRTQIVPDSQNHKSQ